MLGLLTNFIGGFKLYILGAAAVLMLLAGFYLYYRDSQARIGDLIQENSLNQIVIAQQNDAIKKMKKAEEERQAVIQQYYEELAIAREQIGTLESKISEMTNPDTGQTEQIDVALQKHLEQTENTINYEYNNSQKCISLYSGVNINRLEKNKDDQDKLRRACGLAGR